MFRKLCVLLLVSTAATAQVYINELNASQMTKEERERTDAMVNMDTLGLSPTKIWLSHSDRNLVNLAAKVAGSMKLPIAALNFEKVGATDSDSFLMKKMPSISFHS